jgi:magnesium-transporting ATPase (P-type)
MQLQEQVGTLFVKCPESLGRLEDFFRLDIFVQLLLILFLFLLFLLIFLLVLIAPGTAHPRPTTATTSTATATTADILVVVILVVVVIFVVVVRDRPQLAWIRKLRERLTDLVRRRAELVVRLLDGSAECRLRSDAANVWRWRRLWRGRFQRRVVGLGEGGRWRR